MIKTLGQASIFIWTSQDCCSHYKPYHQNQPCGHPSYSEHLAIYDGFSPTLYCPNIFSLSAVRFYKPAIGPQRHIPPWRGLFPTWWLIQKVTKYTERLEKAPAAFLLMNWNSHCSISLAISTAVLSIPGNPKRHSSADFIAKDSQTMFLTLISQIL